MQSAGAREERDEGSQGSREWAERCKTTSVADSFPPDPAGAATLPLGQREAPRAESEDRTMRAGAAERDEENAAARGGGKEGEPGEGSASPPARGSETIAAEVLGSTLTMGPAAEATQERAAAATQERAAFAGGPRGRQLMDATLSLAPLPRPLPRPLQMMAMERARAPAPEGADAMGSTMLVGPRGAGGAGTDDDGAGARSAGGEAGEAARLPASAERFVARGELGRGGMGKVTLAHDRHLERSVAIKQSLSGDAAHQLRFAREVRITARLEHPSIVPIHDAGYDAAGQPYYVMRRLEGQPLDELVRATSSVAERLALVPHVLAAADAAGYAHAQGIIHRDIKPSNILVGSYGETWLIDWGLARELAPVIEELDGEGGADREGAGAGERATTSEGEKLARRDAREAGPALGEAATGAPLDEASAPTQRATPRAELGAELGSDQGLTRLGDVVGTPGFVAPEQARGEPVDERADVYSLGATLLYALTGQLVYPERTADRLLERAAANAPIELPASARTLPSALLAITTTATASRAGARYRSAAELASDLRRFLTGQLVAAHRYSRRERLRRFLRQHRAAAVIAAVALAALAATATLSLRRILDERDRASAAERRAQSQRDLAERRSEQLLLERARVLARSHPTAALATLKLLPAGSDVWPAAWGIAAQAIATGVSFGVAPHRGDAYALAYSPDGARLASGGDDGLVQLHELASRRSRVLAREPSRIVELAWVGEAHLVYATERELVSVELAGGQARRLPIVATRLHALAGGALRYLSGDALHEADGALLGAPRQLLAPARDLVPSAIGTAVATGAELIWLPASGARVTLMAYREPFAIGAVDERSRRLAFSTLQEVQELELGGEDAPGADAPRADAPGANAPGANAPTASSRPAAAAPSAARLVRRLPLPKILALAYSPTGLCLSNGRRSWVASPLAAAHAPAAAASPAGAAAAAAIAPDLRGLSEELVHAAQIRLVAAHPRGCLFVEQTGRATVLADRRRLAVPVRGAPVLAAAADPRSAAFAVGHRGGALEVWPMQALPQLLPLALGSFSMVGTSTRSLYFYDLDNLVQVSRTTGAATPLTRTRWSSALFVEELSDRLLLAYDRGSARLAILELPGGRLLHQLEGVTAIASIDSIDPADPAASPTKAANEAATTATTPPALLLLATGATLETFEPASGRRAPLLSFDEPLVAVAQLGHLALARSATTTWRLDLRRLAKLSGQPDSPAGGPTAAAALLAGAVHRYPLGAERPATLDRAGTCWLATAAGLVRWDGEHATELPLPAELIQLMAHRWLGVLALDRAGKVHTLSPAGELTRTIAASPSAVLAADRPFAVWLSPEGEAVILGDLVGGEQIALPIGRSPATSLSLDAGGAVVLVNLLEREAMIFAPLAPDRAAALAAWLPTATNAELAIDSSEPHWNLPP